MKLVYRTMEIFKSPYHLSFQAVPHSLGDPIKMNKTNKNQCFPFPFGKQHRQWDVRFSGAIPWALEFLMVHLVLLAQWLPRRQEEM